MKDQVFFLVRSAGRTHLKAKVLYTPDRGSVSRTAWMPIARRDLKEAAGKALARRTETA
jgi:hypothetical protein